MKRKKKNIPANSLLINLKEYLLANHVSQEEAARRIGVSWVTVNRWMNGHTAPPTILIQKAIRELIEDGSK